MLYNERDGRHFIQHKYSIFTIYLPMKRFDDSNVLNRRCVKKLALKLPSRLRSSPVLRRSPSVKAMVEKHGQLFSLICNNETIGKQAHMTIAHLRFVYAPPFRYSEPSKDIILLHFTNARNWSTFITNSNLCIAVARKRMYLCACVFVCNVGSARWCFTVFTIDIDVCVPFLLCLARVFH